MLNINWLQLPLVRFNVFLCIAMSGCGLGAGKWSALVAIGEKQTLFLFMINGQNCNIDRNDSKSKYKGANSKWERSHDLFA